MTCSFPVTALSHVKRYLPTHPLKYIKVFNLDCLIFPWVRKEWNHFLLKVEFGSNWETRGWVARECAQIPPRGGWVGTILGTYWIPEDLTPSLSFTGKYLAKPKAYSNSGDFRFKRPPFLKNPFNSSLCKFSRGCRAHGFPTDPGKPETKTLQKRCLGVFAETSYCPEWNVLPPFFAS